jgi:hypothetical protein
MVQSTSETHRSYLSYIVAGPTYCLHQISHLWIQTRPKKNKKQKKPPPPHPTIESTRLALKAFILLTTPRPCFSFIQPLHLRPSLPAPATGGSSTSSFCPSQARLSNTTDSGELGNAGAVSASASEAEEVEGIDVWMKRGIWKGVGRGGIG